MEKFVYNADEILIIKSLSNLDETIKKNIIYSPLPESHSVDIKAVLGTIIPQIVNFETQPEFDTPIKVSFKELIVDDKITMADDIDSSVKKAVAEDEAAEDEAAEDEAAEDEAAEDEAVEEDETPAPKITHNFRISIWSRCKCKETFKVTSNAPEGGNRTGNHCPSY